MARLNKEYQHRNVIYKPIGKKWSFKAERFELIHGCRGGHEIALRVAAQVAGALARTKGEGLDNLARKTIRNIAPL